MGKDGQERPQRPWIRLGIFAALWSAVFALVLMKLIRFSFASELESYIPLIPFISVYLLYIKPCQPGEAGRERFRKPAASILWATSAILVVVHGFLVMSGRVEGEASMLVLPTLSYITGILGGGVFFLGWPAFRATLFPWLLLYLMVPIPGPLAHAMKIALQEGSAEAAYLMFRLTGTPVFREGLSFVLPGLTIEVAEECSGIHSTLVLLITSLIAGHLFLRKTWSRTALVLLVIPLGLIRNGFRIVSISLLTIHVDPGMIDSPLHHRGGPFYFVLSFGVLAAILWGLRCYEKDRKA